MEKSCGMIIFKKFKRQYKVLLIKQINNNWGFPKGHIENNEINLETAIREVKEEVSLSKLKIYNKFYEIEFINDLFNRPKKVIYFLAQQIDKQRPKFLRTELFKCGYFTKREAFKKLTFENSKEILKKAIFDFENINKAAY